MDKVTEALTLIIQSMTQANIAVPIIFSAIAGISAIVKGFTGTGPTLTELADMIQAQIDQNDAFGKAEIDRLKAAIPPTP